MDGAGGGNNGRRPATPRAIGGQTAGLAILFFVGDCNAPRVPGAAPALPAFLEGFAVHYLFAAAVVAVVAGLGGARGATPPTTATLVETVTHFPWLSVPDSRVVVNPNPLIHASTRPASGPGLPMHLGYYAGERPLALSSFWEWHVRRENAPPPIHMDLLPMARDWAADGLDAQPRDGGLGLTIRRGPVTALTGTVTANLDETPYLRVRMDTEGTTWAVKVNAGRDDQDIFLQRDTDRPADASYDVRAVTGWRGRRTFRVRVFAVGQTDTSVHLRELRLEGRPDVAPLWAHKTVWQPHRVASEARSEAPDMALAADVAFVDADTVAQRIIVRRGGPSTLVLTGRFPNGRIAWDERRRRVTLTGERVCAVVSINRAVQWRAAPSAGSGAWSLAVPNVRAGDQIVVTARLRPGNDATLENAPALNASAFVAAVRAGQAAWDARLARVPQPRAFRLDRVDPHGVTPALLRRTYYKAWVFLYANTLPPMPENGYPYPQMACGKPSLWDEGHPKARASAQWESMIAMQLMALVEPEAAWAAYEGMMTLVDEDGAMAGEGLPSLHAQTAWILHATSGDTRRLRAVYPTLKRLLRWKAANPRWIHKGATPPTLRDAEFVVHALLDIGYAVRIARVLGLADEERAWAEQARVLTEQYRAWFWESADGPPFRLYDVATGQRSDRGGSWTLQGLALPPEHLGADQRESLVALLRRLRGDVPFLLPNLTKHPTYMLALRGMWRYGNRDEAVEMAEAAMRDVARAGEFAETYAQGTQPTPSGVAPSVFGAALMVDATLFRNGLMLGGGRPARILPPGAGGVDTRPSE